MKPGRANSSPTVEIRLDSRRVVGVTRFQRSPYASALHLSAVFEEAIEMLGITLPWLAVLCRWLTASPDLLVRFARR